MIRVLVVDDEPPARAKLRMLLGREAGFELVATAADGEEAVAAIRRDEPDVVLLDVQMPRLDGFGVVATVGVEAMPLVVFVTAYDEHALRAFEVNAVDYLLKPFAAPRLTAALDRVRRRLEELRAGRRSDQVAAELRRLLETAGAGPGATAARRPPLRRLRVEAAPQREVLLPVDDIVLLRARRNYVDVVTRDGRYRLRGTLASFEERLDDDFARINRSEIVRLDAVRELQPWFHGDYLVLLPSGETLRWSRRYRCNMPGVSP